MESPAHVTPWKVCVPGADAVSSFSVTGRDHLRPPASDRDARMFDAGHGLPGTGTLWLQTSASRPPGAATRRGADSPCGDPTSSGPGVTVTGSLQVSPPSAERARRTCRLPLSPETQ